MGTGAREDTFERLVRDRSFALKRTAYLLTGDHHLAEDLLQAALTKTYLRWGTLRDEGAAEAYVRRVMVSISTRWWQRRWHGERPTEVLPDRVGDTDEYAHADERSVTRVLLDGLAPRQRAVVVLRFYEDLPEREVADLLGISVGTVKSTTSKALVRLRALAQAGFGPEEGR
jgi:RNA polymerase sigma-70 factor (sigma-E family)